MPIISALRKLKWKKPFEFKVNLSYLANIRSARS